MKTLKSRYLYSIICNRNVTLSAEIRKVLMILRTCIFRYQNHIEALKPEAKVGEMPRISYNELKFEIGLLPEENE